MDTGKGHILIVDGNRANRYLLSSHLIKLGYAITSSGKGRSALETLHTSAFDLIIVNVALQDVDGAYVVQRLQSDEALRRIPVIVVATPEENLAVEKCLNNGALDVIYTPFSAILLKARLDNHFNKKRLQDQLSPKRQRELLRIEDELNIGRQIQASFLPETLPQPVGWEIAARLRSARAVSGDFYDVFLADQDHELCVAIADVCNKGVEAALFMVLIRTLIRAFTRDARQAPQNVQRVVELTNAYLLENHYQSNMFASLFIGILNTHTGNFRYVNSGHPAPLLCRATNEIRPLAPTGPVIGAFPESEFTVCATSLHPGDLLFAFTDGLTDARNPDGDFFTEQRLFEIIAQRRASPHALLNQLETHVLQHIADAAQFDDITMLALQRQAGSSV